MQNKLCCVLLCIRECGQCGWKACKGCCDEAEKELGHYYVIKPMHDKVASHKLSLKCVEIICYN